MFTTIVYSYHLKEWADNGNVPENAQELFNLRHATLRNVVERIFGVCKNRFPLLRNMLSYPFDKQCRLIHACCGIHNFIRVFQSARDLFDDIDNIDEERVLATQARGNDIITVDNNFRDTIADEMWFNRGLEHE